MESRQLTERFFANAQNDRTIAHAMRHVILSEAKDLCCYLVVFHYQHGNTSAK